ncbi:hypothetical protein GF371_00865 [Candidatus Woesearchaeota archaeon]|nr:hypothetical protein [Candidatus Woesearchaeota archaeon]
MSFSVVSATEVSFPDCSTGSVGNCCNAEFTAQMYRGETKTFQANTGDYEIEALFVQDGLTRLIVNGETTKYLTAGDSYKLADGSVIQIKLIDYSLRDPAKSSVVFCFINYEKTTGPPPSPIRYSVDAAVSEWLAVGETQKLQIGTMVYEVTLLGVYDGEAKLKVNGEITDLIGIGEWDTLSDFIEIGIIQVKGEKVNFYIDPVGRVGDLHDISYPMAVGGTGTFHLNEKEYEVTVKHIDRGGAVIVVNGESVKLRNPKAAESFYETHFPIDPTAMLNLWHIVRFNNQLYVDVSVEPSVQEVPIEVVETAPSIIPVEEPAEPVQLDMDREMIIGYKRCIQAYEDDANAPEFKQNYPEQERIRREGLVVCGTKYRMPIPPEVTPEEEYNRCILKARGELAPSEGDFERLPADEQARIKQTIYDRCAQFKPESPHIHPEYERCREELKAFKRMLVEKYDQRGLSVPEELMLKYEEMGNRCRILQGWKVPPRPVPAEEVSTETEVAITAPEERREAAERMERPYRECTTGCMWEERCLPIGTRLVKENGHQSPLFCSVRNTLEPQKQLNERCQNDYECVSNTCQDGVCQSIGKRIEGIERELKEQRNILERIASFFGRLFGRG